MKVKIKYTSQQAQITETMSLLRDAERDHFELTHDDISLDVIADTCASIWECDVSDFKIKTNHKDYIHKLKKECFFYTAYYFSNESRDSILQYASYSGSELFNRSRYLTDELTSRRRFALLFLEIFSRLLQLTPNRFESLVTPESIGCVVSPAPAVDAEQVPIHDHNWFYHNASNNYLYIYKKGSAYSGKVKYNDKQRGTFISLQAFGYRFATVPEPITLSSLTGVLYDFRAFAKLTLYQISKIPVRDEKWISNDNQKMIIYIYHLSDKFCIKYFEHSKTDDDAKLKILQDEGYRFIQKEEKGFFEQLHPICDRCLHANNCTFKSLGSFGRRVAQSDESFHCFEDVPSQPLKAPLSLLRPLEHFQLQ